MVWAALASTLAPIPAARPMPLTVRATVASPASAERLARKARDAGATTRVQGNQVLIEFDGSGQGAAWFELLRFARACGTTDTEHERTPAFVPADATLSQETPRVPPVFEAVAAAQDSSPTSILWGSADSSASLSAVSQRTGETRAPRAPPSA